MLGTALLGSGTATLTVSTSKVLKKSITILYGGDTDFAASTVAPPVLRVVR